MNLKFKVFDGRSDNDIDVINEATNEIVGYIKTRPRSGIRISLFDQKYQGVVSSYEECFGFISGVQSVLNRLVSVNDGRQELENKLYLAKEATKPKTGFFRKKPKIQDK